jgi:hypothetical protein
MAVADLSHPRAKLEWAKSQFNVLCAEIDTFWKTEPYRVWTEIDPETKFWINIMAHWTKPIPLVLSAHLSAIIAAQRDCLDLLAYALAVKNGAVVPRDVYFPVCDSEARFKEAATQRKIRRLDSTDRAIIENIKPYKGGNDLLFALNSLNNESKHRQLVLLAGNQGSFGHRNGHVGVMMAVGAKTLEKPTILAIVSPDSNAEFKVAAQITFGDVGPVARHDVVTTLQNFMRAVESIIGLFV